MENISASLNGLAGRSNAYQFNDSTQNTRSTVAGIFDNNANEWLLRVDRPHKHHEYSHLNINKQLSNLPDPHIEISDATRDALQGANSALNFISTSLSIVTVCNNVLRVVKSAKKGDAANVTKEIYKIGLEYTAGRIGSELGAAAGAKVGAVIFSICSGGTLTIVGYALGSILGSVAGSAASGITANKITEAVYPEVQEKQQLSASFRAI